MFDCLLFFFFKQKTAYDMRISDWSSDVCSSDLAQAREVGQHGHRGGDDVLHDRQVAALGIGVVAVDVAAEHQAALVGLRDVEVAGAEGDDGVDERLQRFRDESLKEVAFARQVAQAGLDRKSVVSGKSV